MRPHYVEGAVGRRAVKPQLREVRPRTDKGYKVNERNPKLKMAANSIRLTREKVATNRRIAGLKRQIKTINSDVENLTEALRKMKGIENKNKKDTKREQNMNAELQEKIELFKQVNKTLTEYSKDKMGQRLEKINEQENFPDDEEDAERQRNLERYQIHAV